MCALCQCVGTGTGVAWRGAARIRGDETYARREARGRRRCYQRYPGFLFTCKNFLDFDTVAFLFLFDKHYLITKQLGLKDSSRDLQVNYTISYLFLSIFNVSCMCRKIRCDGESCKVLSFWVYLNKASSPKKSKTFQDSPSHQILKHIHESSDIDENKN